MVERHYNFLSPGMVYGVGRPYGKWFLFNILQWCIQRHMGIIPESSQNQLLSDWSMTILKYWFYLLIKLLISLAGICLIQPDACYIIIHETGNTWKTMFHYSTYFYYCYCQIFFTMLEETIPWFSQKKRTVNFVRTGLTLSQAGLGRDTSIVGCCFFTAECCDYWERTIAYRWLAITYPRVACSSSCLLLVIAYHPPLMRAHAWIQSSCGNHLTAVFCSPTWDHGVPQDPWPDINRVISDNCPEVGPMYHRSIWGTPLEVGIQNDGPFIPLPNHTWPGGIPGFAPGHVGSCQFQPGHQQTTKTGPNRVCTQQLRLRRPRPNMCI